MVDDIPDSPKEKVVYLITHLGNCWAIVMICPCGCGKLLHLNTLQEYHPSWKYYLENKNRISLTPSINRTVGCKSHFFVKKSRIKWCN